MAHVFFLEVGAHPALRLIHLHPPLAVFFETKHNDGCKHECVCPTVTQWPSKRCTCNLISAGGGTATEGAGTNEAVPEDYSGCQPGALAAATSCSGPAGSSQGNAC